MQEFLVAIACIYGDGCTETYSIYYDSKPSLQEFVAKSEREVKLLIGDNFVTYVAPPVLFLAGSTGTTKLSDNWSLEYNRSLLMLSFNRVF